MNTIKEIDMDKYIVLKKSDINALNPIHKKQLEDMIGLINIKRHMINKLDNQYLILNMNDKIDTVNLSEKLPFPSMFHPSIMVKDIAVDIVNAILKAKIDAQSSSNRCSCSPQ